MKLLPLALVVVVVTAALPACGRDPVVLPGPVEWNRQVVPPEESVVTAQRAACGYQAGALAAETHPVGTPIGEEIPIDHIVVVMMENRSFDHYFQKLPGAGQPDVDVAPSDFANLDDDGLTSVTIHRDVQRCFVDTAHGWNASHQQYNGGKMDGFVVTNNSEHEGDLPADFPAALLSGDRAMTYYEPSDLPFLFWAANTFAMGDRYYSSLLGPTWPNRMFLYAATSFGEISNSFPTGDDVTIFSQLEQRQVNWKVYAEALPGFGILPSAIGSYLSSRVEGHQGLFAAIKAGKLPAVAFIDPGIGMERPAANDEHPPAVMAIGQRFLAELVDALMKSPNWKSTAIFITYDEHGGLYDHVAPPAACPPDDHAPKLGASHEPGAFDRYGIRVPFVVISPYAKPHYVSHRTYDHTSITRFIEARWVMPAMTARDANSEAPFDLFDFKKPSFKQPPVGLPEVIVDQAEVDACTTLFGAQP